MFLSGQHPMRSLAVALLDAAEHAELGRAQHVMRAELLDSLHNAGDYEMHLIGPLAARPVRPCPRRS